MNKIVKSQKSYKKHINRCVAWLLAVFMCFSALSTGSMTIHAEAETVTYWKNYTEEITEGSGTENDPYIISTAGQLAYLSQNYGNYKTSYIKVADGVKELNLSAHYWTPIYSFDGTFDGNGVTIKGLKIKTTSTYNVGLFGDIGVDKEAVVKNLVFEVAVINASQSSSVLRVGIVAGRAELATIENCKVLSGTITANHTGTNAYAGGLVGGARDNSSTISIYNCYNNSDIVYTGALTGVFYVGGLVGGCYGSNVEILNSVNTGSITVANNSSAISSYVGGLTGRIVNALNGGYSLYISNCYNAGKITSAGSGSVYCGGVAGLGSNNANGNTCSVTNCYYAANNTERTGSGEMTQRTISGATSMELTAIQSADFVNTLNTNVESLSETYSGLLKWKLNDSRYPIPSIAAQIGDETYESLAAAINAANAAIDGGASSAEIDLQTDITASRTTVVNAKVILDLNGETLDMGSYYLTSLGDVVDNSTYKTGRLVVAGVDVSSPRALLAANNDQMPVYISSEGAYMLATMTAQAMQTKAEDLSSFNSISRPSFGADYVDKLQGGASAAKLQFILRLDWSTVTDNVTNTYYQEFKYSDDLVKSIYTNGTAFSVTVNGLTNYASSMKVSEYVKSDLGVELLNNSFSMTETASQ